MTILYDKNQIEVAIQQTADVIENDLHLQNIKESIHTPLVCICVLNGAMYFFTKFTQSLKHNQMSIDTIGVKSYNSKKSNPIECYKSLSDSTILKDRDVIIVEDIIDSGQTMKFILNAIKNKHPKSIRVVTLLNRKTSNIIHDLYTIYPDVTFYKCLDINDEWIYGYGLDLNGLLRDLTIICCE